MISKSNGAGASAIYALLVCIYIKNELKLLCEDPTNYPPKYGRNYNVYKWYIVKLDMQLSETSLLMDYTPAVSLKMSTSQRTPNTAQN